uniref:Helicase ATP-binding domain-containing protein n=1 Tax=viral metagenome TaxID=1070528 RepID=A0A6C0L0H0_9ZZZZ|tara:strand:- start:7864 stop:11145 length:3282 start_codon:yes stop_codon:yes gene_type:complete
MVKYYSSINDNEFEKNTCSKKEFKKYVWQPSKNRTQQSALLLPHQQWISNYINPKTPFKGMLVYHETGTGKTCTAISIAENFKDELIQNGKKIVILCSDNIRDEFYRTISNPGTSFKCTGNTYNKMIESSDMTQENLNKKIDEYYTFLTHGKFGREVEKKTKKDPATIREKYSDSLIIIDEAQHLRGKFDSQSLKEKGEKQSHDAIDMISKHANNVKIVFLTATPMYDNPVEIIWMINVLIRVNNDNIEELNPKEIFNEDKGFSFKKEGKEKFIRAIKGKISFLRGGDPESFPLRLPDPKGSNTKNIKTNFLGKPIDPEYFNQSSNSSILTLSRMSKEHFNVINERKENSNNSGKIDHFHMQMMQLHNVRWYKKASKNKDDDDDINALSGLENHFKITKSGIYTPLNDKILNNLNDWSPKANTIVNHILEMKDNGIAFVFSQFVSSGVIPIMLALESKGFSKYGGYGSNSKFNHLKISRKDLPDRGNYIVVTSNKILATTRMREYINIARSKGNETGNKIRVIIASGAGGEGLDLKWIRQVHIMEPHFHLSQIEQAVGRAIRNKSHKELPREKQNCTIFYHATQYPVGINYETIDMHLYRIAMKKRSATIQVRKLIQEYSITCEFFKGVNIFDYNQYFGKFIIDSKGKKFKFTNEMIIDEGYNNKCLICQNILNEKETDSDTYNPNIHSKWHIFEAMKKIQQLFEISDKYSLIDIVTNVQEWNNEIDEESIYFALDIIINSPHIVSNFENQFNVEGTIHQIDNYYVFVPQHTEYTGIHSGIPLTISNQYVPLNIIPWPNRPETEEKRFKKDIDISLVKDYDNLIQKLIFSGNDFWSKIPEIRNELIAEVLIDKLDPENRKYLFFNQNTLTNKQLLKALNRYASSSIQGFININAINTQYNILDKNDSNNILKKSELPKNSKTPRRNFFGYLDYINDKASFYIMDGRKPDKKPSGWKVLAQQKEKLFGLINDIIQVETTKNSKKFKLMNYPRYVYNENLQLKQGQFYAKNNSIKAIDLLVECEMLFRYLDKITDKEDKKWFFSYTEAYDYGIQSKNKNLNKKDDDTLAKKGTTIKKTRRKLKNKSNIVTKRKNP